jgi:putative SOS response-associated peptidase YedK
MAGIWKTTEDGLEFMLTTTTPNEVVAELNDRMPLTVKPRDYESALEVCASWCNLEKHCATQCFLSKEIVHLGAKQCYI